MATATIARRLPAVQKSSLLRGLFTDARAAWIWLPIRLWLGWQWIEAGLHKIDDPAWTQTGLALKGYWQHAVSTEGARPPIAYDWYRSFIQTMLDTGSYTWFAKLVTFGEVAVGIALIIGAFVGLTAFFAGFMNWNYMMAGSASTNPMLFVIAICLLLAWRVSGLVGADYALFNRKQVLEQFRKLKPKTAA